MKFEIEVADKLFKDLREENDNSVPEKEENIIAEIVRNTFKAFYQQAELEKLIKVKILDPEDYESYPTHKY